MVPAYTFPTLCDVIHVSRSDDNIRGTLSYSLGPYDAGDAGTPDDTG